MKKYVMMLLVLILVGCQSNVPKSTEGQIRVIEDVGSEKITEAFTQPPKIFIEYEAQKVEAVIGSYSWTIQKAGDDSVHIDSCSGGSEELVAYQVEPLFVRPGDSLKVVFEDHKGAYGVKIFRDWITFDSVDVTQDTIIIPEEYGEIIYEIHAIWLEGDAYYAFKVTVEED